MAFRLKKSNKNSGTVLVALLLGVFAIMLGVTYVSAPHSQQNMFVEEQQLVTTPISLLFVGDIMFDRGVEASILKNFNGEYSRLFEYTEYLADADIAFGNLEGPVATGGRNVGSRFSFRMDPKGLTAMRDAGFDIVSFANNHVGDYTVEAFTETLTRLKENTILYTGAGSNKAEATAPTIIEIRGVRIGFIAATDVGPDWLIAKETTPGILTAKDPQLEEIITTAKSQVDVLVMSFHWGDEYAPVNARQEMLAKKSIDAGADIIVGHHPHVMQRFEYYNGKPIFYSLGNFIFDQYFSPFTVHGMVGEVSVDPQTLELTMSAYISPQDDFFIPKERFPFEEKFLLTKSFTP